jgi:SAM-dependent methyltransferase
MSIVCDKRVTVGRVEPILGAERDALILRILENIEADQQEVGGLGREDVWERGWREVLAEWERTHDVEALLPRYIRPYDPIRYYGEWVKPQDDKGQLIERVEFENMRGKLISRYFDSVDRVTEFGSGTGWNLLDLAENNRAVMALDFSPAAVSLAVDIGKHFNLPIVSHLIDMRIPEKTEIPKGFLTGAGIFTCGSLEQIPHHSNAFLNWLVEQRPAVVVHIEPMIEMLNPNVLFDNLAIRFLKKRGYSQGILTYLRSLEKEGRIRRLESIRWGFGSLYHEGYMSVVWRPTTDAERSTVSQEARYHSY